MKDTKITIQALIYSLLFIITIFSSIVIQGKTGSSSEFIIQTEEITQVPTWKINDTWTYFANIDVSINNSELNILCEDLSVKVEDIQTETYKIHFFGDATGNGVVEDAGDIEQFAGTIDGYIFLSKDFSVRYINNTILKGDALIRNNSIPVIVHVEVIINNITITPEIQIISFPLFVGKNWSTSAADLGLHGEINVESECSEINITQPSAIPSDFFNCTDITTFYLSRYGINVSAYNISEEYNDKINIMYSPNISSIVSGSFNNLEMGNITFSAEFYLKNSSYIEEATELSINLVKPKEKTFYLWNKTIELFNPLTTLIIGEIEIESEVEGGLGDINVSFYLDDKCMETLSKRSYKFTLDEMIILGGRHKIRVVATDNLGREDEDYIYANLLNFGLY